MVAPSEVFDVVIVGAGIMGSCTAYEVARRGQRALLLEQFDFLHHRGSSHGESRTIRATYPESHYPPLVLESARLWDAAQAAAGYRVITNTRQLDVGPAADGPLLAAIANCRGQSIPIRILDHAQLTHMFSGAVRLPDNWIAALSDVGGVINPTKAVAMFQSLALKHGAVLRDRDAVKEIKKDEESGADGGVVVSTAGGERYRARKCVVTVGAWAKKLVKSVSGVDLPVEAVQTTICYWRIKEGWEAKLSPAGGFPSFASYGDPYFYGTPSLEFPGLIKIGLHGGAPCDPDNRDWTLRQVDVVGAWIESVMPDSIDAAGGPVLTQACMYTMTPDEDYMLDFLGGEFGEDVVVGAGFSGHGFKMGPLIGRILADLALDGTVSGGVDISHFRLRRFEENPRGNAKVDAPCGRVIV